MPEATLVFPHQIFEKHPAIQRDRPVVLIEDGLIYGDDPVWGPKMHRQKIVLHRASMKAFADTLEQDGHRVLYRDHDREAKIGDHLDALGKAEGFDTYHFADPVDDVISRRLRRFADRNEVTLKVTDTPQFLTPPRFFEEHFDSVKKPFMAKFYEAQRERMNLLLEEDGKPVGGRWSFDDENRKKLPKKIDVPDEPRAYSNDFVETALKHVKENYGDYLGSTDSFCYAVTHGAAAGWLDRFLERRFDQFGDYEDAISSRHRVMWHSVLTPMLNIGLLTPQQVIDRTMEFAGENDVPINSLEGFIRQVVGWREFMGAMYQRHGVEMRNGNFWDFEDKPIPEPFYTAETGIPPIDDAIRHALDHGWCHHIERLMLIGNFMLLCRFHPTRVYRWFMELFVDAYDWVMVPNVYGMSQFADGGLFTTKPYLSGSNYVKKMSDYGKGDWCDTWDGLFWSFIADHEDFFRGQYRLSMMAKNLDRMGAEKLNAHRGNAERFLRSLAS